jgi:hypothetical protein
VVNRDCCIQSFTTIFIGGLMSYDEVLSPKIRSENKYACLNLILIRQERSLFM